MYIYFNQILDQYDERLVNEKLASYLPELPESDSDYALIIKEGNELMRKYPINTIENVAYSYASFQKNRSKLSDGMDKIASSNLGKMLNYYGIENDLKVSNEVKTNYYKITQADQFKIASIPDRKERFAVSLDENNYLPIDTVKDWRASLDTLLTDMPGLPPAVKKLASDNIFQRAKELGIEPPQRLSKYASMDLAEPQVLRAAMATRYLVYTQPMQKLADEILKNIQTPIDAIDAIAVIEKIDAKAGVVPEKHFDLAEKFFNTKQADVEFSTRFQEALDDGTFEPYLDSDVIDYLKENGSESFGQLNPRLKNIILNIVK